MPKRKKHSPLDSARPRYLPERGSWLRSETLIIFTGRVQWSKATSYSLVRTKSANLRVWWMGGILPPNVFVGRRVSAVGKVSTYNEGTIFRVNDAVPLHKSYWKVVDPVYRHLWQFLDDPAEWCGPADIDKLKLKREPTAP